MTACPHARGQAVLCCIHMQERVVIGELAGHIGETVSISGFVAVRRDQGKLVFFDFRDRSGTVQGVVLPAKDAGGEALMETAKDTRHEYAVRVQGIVNERPEKNVQEGKQNGGIELEITGIEILSARRRAPVRQRRRRPHPRDALRLPPVHAAQPARPRHLHRAVDHPALLPRDAPPITASRSSKRRPSSAETPKAAPPYSRSPTTTASAPSLPPPASSTSRSW